MLARVGLALAAMIAGIAFLPAPVRASDPMDDSFLPLISNPDWDEQPNGNDLAQFFPEKAQNRNQGGEAVVACLVRKNGTIEDCSVIVESPEGFDFGAAARRMAIRKFRMKPMTIAGKAFDGGLVVVPIMFMPPGMAGPPRIDYMAGDASVLLVPAPDTAKSTIPCPTETAGRGKCTPHFFNWDARPDMGEVEAILKQAGAPAGVSQINCKRDPRGALVDCRLLGAHDASAQAAVKALIPTFKLPEKAVDGTPLGDSRVAVTFDWAHIQDIIDKSRAAAKRL